MEEHRSPEPPADVRASDIEAYSALRWTNEVFKGVAGFLVLVTVIRFVTGLTQAGAGVLPALVIDAVRTFVFAVALWGAADLGRLLMHVGHDIRAERALLARLVARTPERADAAAAAGARPPRTPDLSDPSS